MDLNAISEPVLVQGTAIILAIVSLAGTIITSWFNYREKTRTKTSEAEKAAKEEAAREKKEAEEARKALEEVNRQKLLDEMKKEIEALSAKIKQTAANSRSYVARGDKQYQKIMGRIKDNEDSVTKITQVLAKNARTYSGLTLMNDETISKLNQLSQIERTNLGLTRNLGDILADLSVTLEKMMLHDGNPEHAKHLAELGTIIQRVTAARTAFVEAMLNDSIKPVSHDAKKSGPASDDDVIEIIVPKPRPKDIDADDPDIILPPHLDSENDHIAPT